MLADHPTQVFNPVQDNCVENVIVFTEGRKQTNFQSVSLIPTRTACLFRDFLKHVLVGVLEG